METELQLRRRLYKQSGAADQTLTHEKAYSKAVKNGCTPRWYNGIVGWAWHCDCPGENSSHFADQQCSAVKWYTKH
jgi:hypothetical protein